MRPKERLLRRGNINATELHQLLEEWSDRLGRWEEFWTATVVLGLVVEYLALVLTVLLPVSEHAKLLLEQVGGGLVIIGVAGELAVSRRASRVETDLREISNELLAESNERVAGAEQAAAEANLARVRIEDKFRRRLLTPEAEAELTTALYKYPNFRIDVLAFSNDIEVLTLADMLNMSCRRAGCDCRLFLVSDKYKITTAEGVALALASDATPKETEDVALVVTAVARALHKSKIGYATTFGGFKKSDVVEARNPVGSFPWAADNVAACRIQVSAKNLFDSSWSIPPPAKT